MIMTGAADNLLLWDARNMAKPVGRFSDSHNDDITGIACHGSNVITCGVDNLLFMFNFPENLR